MVSISPVLLIFISGVPCCNEEDGEGGKENTRWLQRTHKFAQCSLKNKTKMNEWELNGNLTHWNGNLKRFEPVVTIFLKSQLNQFLIVSCLQNLFMFGYFEVSLVGYGGLKSKNCQTSVLKGIILVTQFIEMLLQNQ